MLQKRLESLLMIAIEKAIVTKLGKNNIIDPIISADEEYVCSDHIDAETINHSFVDVLKLLTKCHLVEEYPLLSKIISITDAILISSCSAERSFSVEQGEILFAFVNASKKT